MFKSSGGIRFCGPGWGLQHWDPSSITVWMAYSFTSQIWCCELCVENQWVGGRKHYFVNFPPTLIGGWRLVEWGRKTHVGPAEFAPFCFVGPAETASFQGSTVSLLPPFLVATFSISFRFLSSFVENKTETNCLPGAFSKTHTEKTYTKFLINYIKLKLPVKLYRKKLHQTF